MALLKVDNLGITFGGLRALDDVRIEIHPNEIIGLIGPNGAGKTTVFNLLTSVYAPFCRLDRARWNQHRR